MSNGPNIIIVKKKKIIAAAHHGGSWKVAYADFVTAMMAFFMVMWIMNMDEGVKDMVEGSFSNPVGFKKSFSGGRNILSQGNSLMSMEVRNNFIIKRREEEETLRETAEAIEGALLDSGLAEGTNAMVEIVVSDQGLRIEMMETGAGEIFFDQSSARLKPQLRSVLTVIASHIAQLSNGLIVEGHTDGLPFGRSGYSNWELSVDRANSARRVLEAGGLPSNRLFEVRGYADRQLKFVEDALDPRNRRISLLLPFDTPFVEPVEVDPETLAEQLDYSGMGWRRSMSRARPEFDLFSVVAAGAEGIARVLRKDSVSAVLFWGDQSETEVVHRHEVPDDLCRALATSDGRYVADVMRASGQPMLLGIDSLPRDATGLRAAMLTHDLETLAVFPLFGEYGVAGCLVVPLAAGERPSVPNDQSWRVACRVLEGLRSHRGYESARGRVRPGPPSPR